jgi:hypothetical protein
MMGRIAGLKIAAVCCCFLALAACSKKNQPDLERMLTHSKGQRRVPVIVDDDGQVTVGFGGT